MNKFKSICVASVAIALLASSAAPAFAGDDSSGRAALGFFVGVVVGSALVNNNHEHYRERYHDRDDRYYQRDYDDDAYGGRVCRDRIISHHPATYTRDSYGRPFLMSAGYDIVQNTCGGQPRTKYW